MARYAKKSSAVKSAYRTIMKKISFWLIYLGLAGASFIFLQQTLNQFLEGATYFQRSQSVMSAKDIPTLTICFEGQIYFENGNHFLIYSFESHSHLTEGKNKKKTDKGVPYELFLKTMYVQQFNLIARRSCFKLSLVTKGDQEYSSLKFAQNVYRLNFQFNTIAPKEARLYFTSEENAYGITFLKWFEGEAVPYILQNGTGYSINLQVKEIHHITDRCQIHSFYQCLAENLSRNSTCSKSSCATVTLPTKTSFMDLDICKNETDILCKMSDLNNQFNDDDICKGDMEQACVVKEYFPKEYSAPTRKNLNGFSFVVWMDPPQSSHNARVSRPYKTVYREHYIMNGLQLIGTFGGTLGLMIGFSFMGSMVSISEFAAALIQQWNKRRHHTKSNKSKSAITI